ncbi:ComEC/Rec2 family competence protein [Mycoplasma corogypsi]|uniref:ComEC/Rec2 family competence protein n=1 Tax=Mycoplasma corogypsi TaxID=2106 RepID=UPI003872E728
MIGLHYLWNLSGLWTDKTIKGRFKVMIIGEKSTVVRDIFFRQFTIRNNNIKFPTHVYQDVYIDGVLEPVDRSIDSFVIRNIFYGFKKVKVTNTWQWDVRYFFFKYYEQDIFYREVITPLVFGNRSSESNVFFRQLRALGIIHLFVISGFHYNILFAAICYVTSKIDKRKILAFIILAIYFFLLY